MGQGRGMVCLGKAAAPLSAVRVLIGVAELGKIIKAGEVPRSGEHPGSAHSEGGGGGGKGAAKHAKAMRGCGAERVMAARAFSDGKIRAVGTGRQARLERGHQVGNVLGRSASGSAINTQASTTSGNDQDGSSTRVRLSGPCDEGSVMVKLRGAVPKSRYMST